MDDERLTPTPKYTGTSGSSSDARTFSGEISSEAAAADAAVANTFRLAIWYPEAHPMATEAIKTIETTFILPYFELDLEEQPRLY